MIMYLPPFLAQFQLLTNPHLPAHAINSDHYRTMRHPAGVNVNSNGRRQLHEQACVYCQAVQTAPKKCGQYNIHNHSLIYQSRFLSCVLKSMGKPGYNLRLKESHLYEAKRTALGCFLNLQQPMEHYFST